MMPASPAPPTASNLPFHAEASGSHTSNLIAGETTPATRQMAGILSGGGGFGAPAAVGTANVPLTLSAVVIFVSGSASFARSAQVAAEAFIETSAAPTAAASVTVGVCISFPPERQYLTAAGARRASHEHCAAPRVGRAPTLC